MHRPPTAQISCNKNGCVDIDFTLYTGQIDDQDAVCSSVAKYGAKGHNLRIWMQELRALFVLFIKVLFRLM